MQVITRHVVTAEPQRRRSLSDSAGEVCLTAREKYLRQRRRSSSKTNYGKGGKSLKERGSEQAMVVGAGRESG
jgi:hypothetical protein